VKHKNIELIFENNIENNYADKITNDEKRLK